MFSVLKQMRQRTDDYIITDSNAPRREVKSPKKESKSERFLKPVSHVPSPKPFTSTPVSMDYGERFSRPSRPGVSIHHLQPPKTTQASSKPLPGPPSKMKPLPGPTSKLVPSSSASVDRGSSRLSMMTPMPEHEPAKSDRMSLQPVSVTRKSKDSFEQDESVMSSPQSEYRQPSVQQSMKQQPPRSESSVKQQSTIQQQILSSPAPQQTLQQRSQHQQVQLQSPAQLPPGVSKAVVLYNFKHPSDKCLASVTGEQLLVFITKSPENWYFAKNSNGEYGIIPRTYCKLL